MIRTLSYISILAMPIMMSIILLHGWMRGVNMYDSFVEGAGEGFKTALRIMPYAIAIFIAIGLMRKSGAIDYFVEFVNPLMKAIGIPSEILPLAFIRPISGSGALAVLEDILKTYGADSFIGRVASTMMGSAETVFYTMAVYFGSVGIKNGRHTVAAALISHCASLVASIIICSYFFTV